MRALRVGQSVLAVALIGLAAGCSSSESPSTGQMSVVMTDSPIANVQSATVWVSKVYLIGGSDSTGTQYVITDTPAQYDLLQLQGGVTAALGTATIPTGSYSQLRMVVDSARLVLAGGLTFVGGADSATVMVPSGMQTGIKVNFQGPVQVTPGQTILVVDFNAAANFRLTGTALAPTGVLFTPVLNATVQNVAGSIAGTVTPASSKATVYAIYTSSGDTLGSALADTTTGAYKIWYLPPGAYTVSAAGSGLSATDTVTLNASQILTGVDFQ
jgi:Domain of unknown function (DUF4382)